MEAPNVMNVLTDTTKDIRYEVIAYRALTEEELYMAVRVALGQMKRKPKKNSTCQIVTVIGARD